MNSSIIWFGLLLLLEIDADAAWPSLVEPEFGLGAVEADGAVAEPLRVRMRLGQPVEGQHLFGVVAPAGLDDLLRLGVGEAAVGVDDRAAEPFVEEFRGPSLRVNTAEKAEARLVRAQRAELVRQSRSGSIGTVRSTR